jgi:hypothetical protein
MKMIEFENVFTQAYEARFTKHWLTKPAACRAKWALTSEGVGGFKQRMVARPCCRQDRLQ